MKRRVVSLLPLLLFYPLFAVSSGGTSEVSGPESLPPRSGHGVHRTFEIPVNWLHLLLIGGNGQ